MTIRERNLSKSAKAALHGGSQYIAPIAAAAAVLEAATDISGGSFSVLEAGLDAQPDVPRTIRVVFVDGDTGISAGTVTVTGYDERGNPLTEDLGPIVTATTLTYETTKAFSHLTSVTGTFTGAGAADTMSVGVGNVLGLPRPIAEVGDILAVMIGTTDDLAAGGALDVANQTYTPNTNPDASNNYRFQFAA